MVGQATSALCLRLPLLPVLLFLCSSSVAAAPTAPSVPQSSPSSSCSDSDGSSSACIGSTSAAAVVALIFVGVVCAFLLLWCSIRVLAGCQSTTTAATRPPSSSLCCLPWRRRPTPQVHLHLHPSDSPSSIPSSSPPLPWCASPYPFLGHYRIGRNSHLSPFTLLAHFQPSPYPRRLLGSGVDGGSAFTLVDGVWTVEGVEHRCVFRERFEDGSGYLFTGQCTEGEGGRWKGHWWKEGGAQTGLWSMQPDEDRWRAMQAEEEEERRRRREGGDATSGGGEGGQGSGLRGWRGRRSPVVRWELEERKEVTAQQPLDADAERRQRQTAVQGSDEVAIEMTALQQQQPQQPHSPLLPITTPSSPLQVEE